MLLETRSSGELTREEQERLDKLLSAARRFHYFAFMFAGLSLIISSMGKISTFTLPIVNIVIPDLQAIVGIYLLVLVLTLVCERLFTMAYPWLKIDRRKPPFAWIALGSREITIRSVSFWLMLPVLICAISTANSLEVKDITGFTLSFAAVVFIMLPKMISEYWYLIRKRLDHRGGAVTLSMWLLYCYRLERGLSMTTWLFAPVVAVVPKWRQSVWYVVNPLLILWVVTGIIRGIACSPFIYKRIDLLGKKFIIIC